MKKDITIGEKYGKAMNITSKEEADAYFIECVQHTMSFGKSKEEAENIERQNIGYYSGYYGSDTVDRVKKLFNTVHPVFD